MSLIDVGLVISAVTLTLLLSVRQSFISSNVGSDHPAHLFMINNIRFGGYHLYVQIPRLLNTCYCAAIPMYIYWVAAHFRGSLLRWSERLLNPVVNTAHVIVFALLALIASYVTDLPPMFVGMATCLFALTPQFYHAFSARNMGFSARGTGLLLLTLFFLAAYGIEAGVMPALAWPSLIVFSWLIWGFNTFAQQALCIVSVLLVVCGGRTMPLLGTLLGLVVFIALHPTYSMGYLKHTLRFLRTYAKELAPIYILARRKSIWRDLVWDIWVKLRVDIGDAARYAYGNSILVVLVLNPMVALTCWALLSGAIPRDGFIAYSAAVGLAGALAALLTSFQMTRFLGEPERYAEAVAPWATIAGSYFLFAKAGWWVLAFAGCLFLLVDLLQLYVSKLLIGHISKNADQLHEIEAIVRDKVKEGVRFCSNNEHFTKVLMQNSWQYACCLSVGQDYCGMKLQEAFSSFPLLKREACERIVATYRVNACLLDRNVFDTLFVTAPEFLRTMTVAYDSPRFRLLILDWAEANP